MFGQEIRLCRTMLDSHGMTPVKWSLSANFTGQVERWNTGILVDKGAKNICFEQHFFILTHYFIVPLFHYSMCVAQLF